MKKSLVVAATVGAAALVLSACGAPPAANPSSTSDPSATGSATTAGSDFKGCLVSDEGGWDDASFNKAAFEGLEQAETELGIQTQAAESTVPSDYTSNLDVMVQGNCGLTIGVGFKLAQAVSDAATANPDVNFALIDAAPESPIENVKPLLFNTQEAAYLAGYLAAGYTKTGKVATYGGIPIPSVKIFMDGFAQGVEAHNEAKGTSVEVLGWNAQSPDSSTFTGDFTNVEAGLNTTQSFLTQGADIIFPVAGPVGGGSLRAVKTAGNASVIWVDTDGYLQPDNADYKDVILTSVTKGIGEAVLETLKDTSGGGFSAEPYIGTLDNEGVGLAPFHDFDSEVSADLKSEIEQLRSEIVAGTLKVDSQFAN